MKTINTIMMQRKLESIARKFLMDAYGLELKIPVIVNPRLKRTYGRFVHTASRKESLRIEIGKNYIEHQDWTLVLQTLKHECIHHALYELDMPYRDGDWYFENELKKHGSHSTGTVKYKGKVHVYECSCCEKKITRKRRLARNCTWVSGCCSQGIIYVGEMVV